MAVAELFLMHAADFLEGHYLPKIEQCVAILKEEDLWWRPNEQSNSIANLILHLSGNTRQWIISGVGGGTDDRKRQEEFNVREGMSGNDLTELLRSTVTRACAILRTLDASSLESRRHIQHKEVSTLYAVFHVVEHFSMHTGQIIALAKEKGAKDLKFYAFEGGRPMERWRK